MDFSRDLKFHSSIDHHHNLVGVVDEIFPALAGRVRPDTTAEAASRPIGLESFLVHPPIPFKDSDKNIIGR
jgi:hypothetical protein